MPSAFADKFLIHALLVPLRDRVGLISLSRKYKFELTPAGESREALELVKVAVLPATETTVDEAQEAVSSLTVLYGENGWGKTHLMLESCKSLANGRGERRVALIWELDGQLLFDPGSFLKRQVSFLAGNGAIVPELRLVRQGLHSIFYTTSPFEAAKRRRLETQLVFDVTPSFSPDNPFNGGALLKAYEKLPGGFSFIEEAEARVRIKFPSLRSVLEKLLSKVPRNGSEQQSETFAVNSLQRRTLLRVPGLLQPHLEQALVSEFLVAQLDAEGGRRRANRILSSLLERLHLFNDSNGSALIDDELRELCNEVVLNLTSQVDGYPRGDYPNPLHLRWFLSDELPQRIRGLDRHHRLGKLSEAFKEMRESEWELIEHASRLGLIRWSFRALSSGQVALLLLFSSLSSALGRLETANRLQVEGDAQRPAFLFIDEGEMFMHPAWQRRYITDLLAFLARYPTTAKNLHVVLSTHSMIVAADAPPNRLFDVKLGAMNNGFGYGPKDLLDHVYRVGEFQGEHAGRLMQRLVSFLRNDVQPRVPVDEAVSLVTQIADDRLRQYLQDEVRRAVERQGA